MRVQCNVLFECACNVMCSSNVCVQCSVCMWVYDVMLWILQAGVELVYKRGRFIRGRRRVDNAKLFVTGMTEVKQE